MYWQWNHWCILGYGIGCTGNGIIGVYKLVMSFDKIVEFITKLDIGCRDSEVAASVMDFTLKHYIENVR